MRTTVIIPARLAATRLPNKPLLDLGGVPLVVRVARQAHKCQSAVQVVVATDSALVEEVVTAHGIACVRTAESHPSGTDRVAEAARLLAAEQVVNLQGDEPFVEPADLDRVIAGLSNQEAEIVTLATRLKTHEEMADPNVVKVVLTDAGRAMYFSRAEIPYNRNGHPARQVYGHIGIYGYTREALEAFVAAPPHPLEQAEGLEQLRALAMGLRIDICVTESRPCGIDTPEDLARARIRISN